MGRPIGVEVMENPFVPDRTQGEWATVSFWNMTNPMVLVLVKIYRLAQAEGPKSGAIHPAYADGWWDFADKLIDILEEEDYLIDLLEDLYEQI